VAFLVVAYRLEEDNLLVVEGSHPLVEDNRHLLVDKVGNHHLHYHKAFDTFSKKKKKKKNFFIYIYLKCVV
jgi:hypothetical protein